MQKRLSKNSTNEETPEGILLATKKYTANVLTAIPLCIISVFFQTGKSFGENLDHRTSYTNIFDTEEGTQKLIFLIN